MLRFLAMALLVALFAAFTAGMATSAGNAALETAVGPEALVRLEQEGKITVRALRAWGRLPDRYVALGRSLRADTGLNLLNADAATVAGWLAKAEGGDSRFGPAAEGLKDLLGYLEQGDFLDWETVADEGAVAPGALLRQSGRRWVKGADDGASGLATSSAPAAQTSVQHAGQDAARTLIEAVRSVSTVKKQMTEKSAEIGNADVVVGELEQDGVTIFIPSDSTGQSTVFHLRTVENVPEESNENGQLIGHPIEIDVESDLKRFDSPLRIQFRISDQDLSAFRSPYDVHIAYHNGYEWEYLKPSQIDRKNGVITLLTYHCSYLALAKPSEIDEMMKQVSKEMAVESVTVDKNAELRKTTEHIVKKVMGENVNKSLLRDIVEGILDQHDYTQLAKAVANGNLEEFKTQFIASYGQVTANTLWAYSAKYADSLGDISANLGLVGAFGSSAALIDEGDYEAAAKELAKGIIETQPLGKLLLTAVNVTNRQIQRWKNEELEAAYQIYLNGHEPSIPFWGYGSIEAGDFNEIWNQMRGVRRQIIIDAVADFKAEHGREPSRTEREQIERDAKKALEAEFSNRRARESDIADAEKKNLEFLEIMREGNLLTTDRYGFDPEKMSYRDRARQLLTLRNRVLVDTGRKMNFGGEDTSEEINVYTVSRLITTYLRDGEDAYRKTLLEEGFVEGFNLASAAGTYKGMLKFEKNDLSSASVESKEYNIDNNVIKGVRKVTRTFTTTAMIDDAEISLELRANGKVSIRYTVKTKGSRKTETSELYPNGKGWKFVVLLEWDLSVEEEFTELPFNTTPAGVTELKDIVGNRYKSGTEKIRHPGSRLPDVNSEYKREFVSCFMKRLNGKVEGSRLIISGDIDFEYPILGVVSKPPAASFRIEIESKR